MLVWCGKLQMLEPSPLLGALQKEVSSGTSIWPRIEFTAYLEIIMHDACHKFIARRLAISVQFITEQ
jgi:hypothetical protein